MEAAGAVLVCVLTGLSGVYYAFFSWCLVLAAGTAAAIWERRWTTLAASALPALFIAGALAARWRLCLDGSGTEELRSRGPLRAAEANIYGLNVSEMLLPIYQHRIDYFAQLRERFVGPPRRLPGRRRPSRSAPWRPSASSTSSAAFCGGDRIGPSGAKTASPI